MIDRKRVQALIQDEASRLLGRVKRRPWGLSWWVLMGLLQSSSDEDFQKHEPRFAKAYRTISIWLMRYKRNPTLNQTSGRTARQFSDEDFEGAFNWLMERADATCHSCRPDNPQFEIRHAIWHLRDKLPYWPKQPM